MGEYSTPLWSFHFLSKMMPATNCVRFCQNPFCREVPVDEGCLPLDKSDLDIAAHISLD